MGSSPVDNIYIIHEPLCDSSFKSFITSTADEEERRQAFIQTAEGLAHLHDRGIMHRDMKPGNIMLATRNPLRVVIIDYGHATFATTSIDHYKGTIAYLAPEIQALKNGQSTKPYDKRCDVWALGLVGYLLFARLQDLKGKVTLYTYGQILQNVKNFSSEVSGPISESLSWNTDSRPQANELLRMLQNTSQAEV